LNIVGSSNKIITGGENVFPSELNQPLERLQLVNDVCVIGVTHHQWGQVVTAIYVPSNSTVTTAELQAVLEDKLSKYKRPKYWIPLTKFAT